MARKSAVSEYLAQIGRKGGKATGEKGLAAMTKEQRKAISRKGVAARRAKAATAKKPVK